MSTLEKKIDGDLYVGGDLISGSIWAQDSQILVTVSDTTTVLNTGYKRYLTATGTGVQQTYDLGDATTYQNGYCYEIENASSEFVGVVNSNSTVWERVPPRWTIRCRLTDNSTAAGVWTVFWLPNTMAKNGYHMTNDFQGLVSVNHCYSELAMTGAIGAGGANIQSGTVGNSIGVIYSNVSALNSYALLYAWRYSLLGHGPSGLVGSVFFNLPSTAAEEYIARFGFGDNITGGAHTNGAYFYYDRATNGDLWATRTISAAGGTTTNTTDVAPSTNVLAPNKLRVEVSSDAARADFFIGTVLKFSHIVAANIPTAATAFINQGITKTVDTAAANRYLYIDYTQATKSFTVPR